MSWPHGVVSGRVSVHARLVTLFSKLPGTGGIGCGMGRVRVNVTHACAAPAGRIPGGCPSGVAVLACAAGGGAPHEFSSYMTTCVAVMSERLMVSANSFDSRQGLS